MKLSHALSGATFLFALSHALSLPAQTIQVPGADGSDGAFEPLTSVTIDLGAAASGPMIQWDTPSPVPGNGVYDPEMHAVVFKYSSVTIPDGVTVDFLNHPKNPPVVWLVQGDVTIDAGGVLDLGGENGTVGLFAALPEGGPGGFTGGRSQTPTDPPGVGGGPGGGDAIVAGSCQRAGGSYATDGGFASNATYGNAQVVPIVGGSGGAAGFSGAGSSFSGGAGGGALLIASTGTIRIDGGLVANGGNGAGVSTSQHFGSGGGSGGAIRLLAFRIDGTGSLAAVGGLLGNGGGSCDGGPGGTGRVRLEAIEQAFAGTSAPFPSLGAADDPALLWAPDDAPRVRIVSIDGLPVPLDPCHELERATADLFTHQGDPMVVVIETTNVDLASTVSIRVSPQMGFLIDVVPAQLQSGTFDSAIWEATVTLADNVVYSLIADVRLP